jgi:hypothetical protein
VEDDSWEVEIRWPVPDEREAQGNGRRTQL